jgi:hypothetical protein
VVVVMTLAAASRLQVTDSRLKDYTVRELYEEYERPGTLLNHIKENQPGWTVLVEISGRKYINFPVSLQWISEKYEELRPCIQLFPISTAAFVVALLLRVLEKVQYNILRGLIVAAVLPLLWMTFLHSKRANDITFFTIGLNLETASKHSKDHSGSLPSTKRNERAPLLEKSYTQLWTGTA